MRVTEDLGFSSLVLLVVWFIVPLIAFVIHRKWQFALARQEEIKRLLILAAEEAARAENEASYAYTNTIATTFSAPKIVNQCVVCFSPTTTRCSRCKAVRYCSGKCQIVHWRQGHREECHPPTSTSQDDDVFDDHKVAAVDRRRILDEKSEVEGARCKTVSKKPPLSGISSHEATSAKEDINDVEPLAAGIVTDSNSDSSGNSFSGFSSTVASESSDDASVCESVISNEPERSEGQIFANPALDTHDANSSDNSVGMAMPSSPKFANLVDSIDGISIMRNLNETRPSLSKEKDKLAQNGSTRLSIGREVTTEPQTVSSGFWDKALDSKGTEDEAKTELLLSHSNGSADRWKSGSSSSIYVSASTLPPMHVQEQEEDDSASDSCSLDSFGSMASAGSTFSENDNMYSLKGQISTSLNCKKSNNTDFSTMRKDNYGPPASVSHHSSSVGKNSGSLDGIRNLQSASSKASNKILVEPDSASHQLESVEVRGMPNAYAGGHLESRTKSHAYASTACGNTGVQSSTTTPSQVASRSPTPKNGLKTSMLKVVDQFKGSNSSKRLPLAVGSDVSGRYSDKGLFSYDLFVKLYNWNKADLQPFGLVNCGNSCYANAVLQCLAFTPPLTSYFLQGLHSKACANIKKGCFTCEFESLVLKSKATKSVLSPKSILSQLQNIGSRLGNGREEDAHEFLRSAIDTMQLVCLTEAGLTASGSSEEETTLMGLTFGGYLRSKIKCMKCGGKSERQERMMDLTVAIEGEITTLEEALRQFTSTEALEGENKYHCVRCKSYENAKKKLTVSEAPNILTIALKRFQSGKFGKLNKPIRFPEILDLAPFMSGTSDKSPIYRLYGVVVHLDVMNAAFSGHYVCYVKNSQNKWFKVDDSVVTAVELERVLTKGAYLLLYARCSPRAPRLIRNAVSCSDSKSKAANGKIMLMKSRWLPTNSIAAEYFPSSASSNGSATLDPFNSKFHHMKRIMEDDSSSDNSSLISTNSDEGSCSTDSTRYSTSTDDFSEYIFGESGCGWNNTCKNSDFDTPSSLASSPLNLRHSPLSDKDRYDSGFPDFSRQRSPAG